MNAIGQPISRIDGRLKVTGGARYNADIVLAGAAHAAIVHSTIANGRLIGTLKRKGLPVVAVQPEGDKKTRLLRLACGSGD
jgi:CO/xanthine dehydrogenase Mo-binding subunit